MRLTFAIKFAILKWMRKAVFCFIVLLFYCFIVVTPAHASDNWKSMPQNTCPTYPIISACNLNFILETNIRSLAQLTVGVPNNPESTKNSLAGALISSTGTMVKIPPASSREYFAYYANRFHVPGTPTTAYAAGGGIGYESMTPVLKIWTVTRNLAYLFFAIVFIIIGVMILIRSKIDPKTTLTIQNALPKIILALIAVTFSYAIAGFLIDLMYVSLGLIVTLFHFIDGGFVAKDKQLEQLLNGSIFEFVTSGGWWDTTTGVAGVISGVTYNMIAPILSGVGGAVAGLIAGGLGILIIGIAIIWALFKTWLALVGAYANIILGIILSPLQLMMDAIPGQNQLSGWLRNMLANLLAFPLVVAMLAIGSAIVSNFGNGWGSEKGFIPPLVGVGDMGSATALIGLGILLTIPKAVEMLQEILKSPKSKFGSAWGEAVGAGQKGTTALGGWAARKADQNIPQVHGVINAAKKIF